MKMLCIDGGGIRGVYALAILKEMEELYERPVGELFDVIAGTSTGSIIAACIARNLSMDEVLDSYKKHGSKIFIHQAKVGLFKSVYSDKNLRNFLKEKFKDSELSNIKKPLLIPAVDLSRGKPFVHRSDYGHPESINPSIKLWDAVLSSCSAPVYFPPNNVNNRYLSIDGGLWANNPSLVCVTEALDFFKCELNDLKILSLGTGQQNIDFSNEENNGWGLSRWLPFNIPSLKVTPKLIDLALHLSSESVSYHCQRLLGENYLRINEDLGEEIPFDELKQIDKVTRLGKEAFDKKREQLQSFLDE